MSADATDTEDPKVLTAKGSRQAEAVLEAAIHCLGADGYAGTSLQRVADEAGVQKRMVLYYFGSREKLMAAALERLSDEFLAELEARIEGIAQPAALIDAIADMLWEQVNDRLLLAAYFGLIAESASDPVLQATLEQMRQRSVALAERALDELEAAGHELSMERELFLLTAVAASHGIGLEMLQRGPTPELERAIAMARLGAPLLLFD